VVSSVHPRCWRICKSLADNTRLAEMARPRAWPSRSTCECLLCCKYSLQSPKFNLTHGAPSFFSLVHRPARRASVSSLYIVSSNPLSKSPTKFISQSGLVIAGNIQDQTMRRLHRCSILSFSKAVSYWSRRAPGVSGPSPVRHLTEN
jgi:hypothetical protein